MILNIVRYILLAVWVALLVVAVHIEMGPQYSRFDLWLEPSPKLLKGGYMIGGEPYIACRQFQSFALSDSLFLMHGKSEARITIPNPPGTCKGKDVHFVTIPGERFMRERQIGADMTIGVSFVIMIFRLFIAGLRRWQCRNQG